MFTRKYLEDAYLERLSPELSLALSLSIELKFLSALAVERVS